MRAIGKCKATQHDHQPLISDPFKTAADKVCVGVTVEIVDAALLPINTFFLEASTKLRLNEMLYSGPVEWQGLIASYFSCRICLFRNWNIIGVFSCVID